jgi:hypothetical protein
VGRVVENSRSRVKGPKTLESFHVRNQVVKLRFRLAVLIIHFPILGLPLIALLLNTLYLTFKVLRLDVDLPQPAKTYEGDNEGELTKTYFSTVSLTFFSAASSSSSRSWTLRRRLSLVDLLCSPSMAAALVSLSFASAFSRSSSRTPIWCLSEVISWSF